MSHLSRIPVPKSLSSISTASHSSSKAIHKNVEDDLKSINECFVADGLSVAVNDTVKLKHLWKKLVRTEQALKDNYNEMESLKKQTHEEMQAVESYVAHIRSLSEQRDKLSKEFELENENLKKQIIQVYYRLPFLTSRQINSRIPGRRKCSCRSYNCYNF